MLSTLSSIYAEPVTVPNTFNNGEVADADKVNENFNHLSTEINSAKTRLDGLEGNSSATSFHTISYGYKTSVPGDIVTINNSEYRVARLPFLEFSTNDRCAVTFLDEAFISSTYKSLYFRLDTNHVTHNCWNGGENIDVNGFQATLSNVRDSRTYSFSHSNDSANFDTRNSYQVTLCFYIGETQVDMTTYFEKIEQPRDSVLLDDFDMTDNINWVNHGHDNLIINAIDDFIDYIKIEKLPAE